MGAEMPASSSGASKLSWSHLFGDLAAKISSYAGKPISFILAAALILIWLITGPIFHYSDTWQLVINTSTTIITFLMVFLIQNTQNRDTLALQLKLDELIVVTKKARDSLAGIEDASPEELQAMKAEFDRRGGHAANGEPSIPPRS